MKTNGMTHDVTFEKTEFDYYEIIVDGKRVRNVTVDKMPSGKFGVYSIGDEEYLIEETTLKNCKEWCYEFYGYGI